MQNGSTLPGTPRRYRATEAWNQLLSAFQQGMPVGKHRHCFQVHENCFVAKEAISWLHKYMKNNPGVIRKSVTRKQAMLLLQKFHAWDVFENVRGKENSKPFADDGKLYRFVANVPSTTQLSEQFHKFLCAAKNKTVSEPAEVSDRISAAEEKKPSDMISEATKRVVQIPSPTEEKASVRNVPQLWTQIPSPTEEKASVRNVLQLCIQITSPGEKARYKNASDLTKVCSKVSSDTQETEAISRNELGPTKAKSQSQQGQSDSERKKRTGPLYMYFLSLKLSSSKLEHICTSTTLTKLQSAVGLRINIEDIKASPYTRNIMRNVMAQNDYDVPERACLPDNVVTAINLLQAPLSDKLEDEGYYFGIERYAFCVVLSHYDSRFKATEPLIPLEMHHPIVDIATHGITSFDPEVQETDRPYSLFSTKKLSVYGPGYRDPKFVLRSLVIKPCHAAEVKAALRCEVKEFKASPGKDVQTSALQDEHVSEHCPPSAHFLASTISTFGPGYRPKSPRKCAETKTVVEMAKTDKPKSSQKPCSAEVTPKETIPMQEQDRVLALSLCLLLLPKVNHQQLYLLLKITHKMLKSNDALLQEDQLNPQVILSKLSECIIPPQDDEDYIERKRNEKRASQTVQFMVDHYKEIFTLPAALKEEILTNMEEAVRLKQAARAGNRQYISCW